MILDQSFKQARVHETLVSDAKEPLYPGCKLTRLSAVLNLFTIKAIDGWSYQIFTELLKLLKTMLQDGNTLPIKNYEANKVLCPLVWSIRRYTFSKRLHIVHERVSNYL